MKIVAIIQARMGSSRLPGKVLMDLNGKPLIEQIIRRLKFSNEIDDIVLATTTNSYDDKLVSWSDNNEVKVFRGDENNVLKRYYDAAVYSKADIIVRITADDPFKDPNVIDSVIKMLKTENLDFAYNNNPPSFPEGLDTEVFTFAALEKSYNEATSDFDKEHVTQYMYKHPNEFTCKNFSYESDLSYIRLTVDTQEDFTVAKEIYKVVDDGTANFLLSDVLNCLKNNPDILNINKNVKRSAMYVKNN